VPRSAPVVHKTLGPAAAAGAAETEAIVMIA